MLVKIVGDSKNGTYRNIWNSLDLKVWHCFVHIKSCNERFKKVNRIQIQSETEEVLNHWASLLISIRCFVWGLWLKLERNDLTCWVDAEMPPGRKSNGKEQHRARVTKWMPLWRKPYLLLLLMRNRNNYKCLEIRVLSSLQFSSVALSCPTLCDPMNPSTPGLPVHHQLPEFTQTHMHCVGDAIQPSHPLSSPSPPAPNPSQH